MIKLEADIIVAAAGLSGLAASVAAAPRQWEKSIVPVTERCFFAYRGSPAAQMVQFCWRQKADKARENGVLIGKTLVICVDFQY